MHPPHFPCGGPLRSAPFFLAALLLAGWAVAPTLARAQNTGADLRRVPTDSVTGEPRSVALPGVRATATPAPRTRELREFYARVERGSGRYITRAQIDLQKPLRLTDLFRAIPSLSLTSTAIGERAQMTDNVSAGSSRDRGPDGECAIQYFVDGTPFEASHGGMIGIDLRPSEVEGIEIYRNSATVPARFRRTGASCGTILIWKRERI